MSPSRTPHQTSDPIDLEQLARIATRERNATRRHLLARTTTVQLIDDIDGSQAAETVRFAVDGRTYEIDLSTEHAESLRHSLAQFRRRGTPSRPGRREP